MPMVRYVGHKDKEIDTVAGTETVWIGRGDVQPVSDKAWAVMCKHPDVWELAEDASETGLGGVKAAGAFAEREKALNAWGAELDARERALDEREAALSEREKNAGNDDGNVGSDPADPYAELYGMNTEALRKYAKEHAPELATDGMKGQALRAAIIEALKAKA